MSDDPNQQDRLLELIFGLLPEDEASELRAEIEKDAALAEAYADAQADVELMGEAAKLQSPRIVLSDPEPNGHSGDTTPGPPYTARGPEITPWSRWAQWGLVAAASLLVLLSLVGWAQRRSQLAGVGADRLRLQVTGPSQLQQSVDSRFSIATTTATGRPVSASIHFAVYSPDGDRLLGHTEKTGDDGTLQLDIPADLQLPDTVRIEVEAGEENARQVAESRLSVRREPLSTFVRLDRARYAPGETVHYRAVSLSRFHLEPESPFTMHFEIVGPRGAVADGSQHQTLAERGVAAGKFTIATDARGGIYTLLVRSPDSAFSDVRREFLVFDRQEAELVKDLEFADIGYGPGMEVNAAFRVTRCDGTPLSEAAVQLAVKAGEETVFQDSTTTDSNGALSIAFRLPEQVGTSEVVLAVTVDDGTVRETVIEPVPMGRGQIAVEFFPEGGDLAAVGENRVYFAARDSQDDPVNLTGWIVDQEGNYHARVETLHEGRGMFRFSPRVGIRYRLRLESPSDAEVDGQLPFVMPAQKVVLNTGAGIFEPGEPLEFNVRASQPGLPLVAMASCRGVHVGEQAFLTKRSENGNGRAAANAVAIAMPDAVAGVIRLTVFDYSVAPPNPVAERLVYRRPLEQLRVAFETDRENYVPGESCQLRVSVSDENGQPVKSLLGLSVVDEAVLGTAKSGPTTMSSYFWLMSEIEHPQDWEDANFLLEDTPEAEVALDLLLGTEGWRRFTDRSEQRWHRNQGGAEPLGQLVAVGPETSPPLMLDNLSSLLASSDAARRGNVSRSGKSGHLLTTLIVLGGAGMLVLVTMLSLLKIASGVRLWTPAMIAVGVSFFLAFLAVSPDSSTDRAVAFQSYCPPQKAAILATVGQDRGSSAEKESDSGSAMVPIDLEESKSEPADKMESEERPKLDAKAVRVGQQEDVPMPEPAIAEPLGGGMKETQANESVKSESSPKSKASADGGAVGRPLQEELARDTRDIAPKMGERPVFREYRAEAASGDNELRTDFTRTVLWTPLLETDTNGQAQESFELSDSVTRFRAIADAHGSGRIGSAIDTIVSKLPFHLSPEVPKEVTLGDRIDIPLVITDESLQNREVHLSVEATEGLRILGDTEVTSRVDEGTRNRRIFSAEATGLSKRVAVRFRGHAGEHIDAIERGLRIEPPGYPQAKTISGILENEQELRVVIPEDVVPGTVNATLTFFPSLAGDLQSGLESISGSSYDAVVATLTVADLSIEFARQNSIADPQVLRLAKKRREESLLRFAEFRDSGGGYSQVERGVPGVVASAEALLTLRADREVFATASAEVERTFQWLAAQSGSQLDSTAATTDTPGTTARAWRLWALAEAGQADLDSELEQVATQALEAKEAQAIAVAALAADRLEHDLSAELLDALTQQQAQDGHLTGRDISDTEVTAIAALAWLRQPSNAKPAEDAVAWLLSARDESGGFGSDRGTALALQVLVLNASNDLRLGDDAKISVRLDDEVVSDRNIEADRRQTLVLHDLSAQVRSGENLLRLALTEGNRLPYTLVLHYNRREQPTVSPSHPLKLHTEFDKSKSEEGQTVRLSLRLENRSKEAVALPVVEIGLPAGLMIAPALLDAEEKAGRITGYETRPRQLILFWDAVQPDAQVEMAFDATASLPGQFSGPPSSAYLSEDPGTKSWTKPLTIEVDARK